MKKIVVLNNEFEAQLLDDALTRRSIPHVMRNYMDSALSGLFQATSGWGHVEAPEQHRKEILEIVADLPEAKESDPG